MKSLNPYRFALAVQILGSLSMTIAASHFVSPWLSLALFTLSWIVIISFMGSFKLWQPWWLDQTELPDTRPVWLTSAAFDMAAIIGAVLGFSWWEIMAVRGMGGLMQLAIVGRARQELEKNHEEK